MTAAETQPCPRCGIKDAPKAAPPPPYVRCTDSDCPLNTAEQNATLKASKERANG